MHIRSTLIVLVVVSLAGFAIWPAAPARPETSLADLAFSMLHGHSARQVLRPNESATHVARHTMTSALYDRLLTPPPHAHPRSRAGS